MMVKSLKSGTLHGYFNVNDPKEYCGVFLDGHDAMSFSSNEFEYIDSTRYNSPLFCFNTVRELFGTPLGALQEEDVVGHQHELRLTSFNAKRLKILKNLARMFTDYEVTYEEFDDGGSPAVVIKTQRTIHELLNFAYVTSVVAVVLSRINLYVDDGLLERIVRAANIIKAPYYVRYLIRLYLVHDDDRFQGVKSELMKIDGHSVNFAPISGNMSVRKAEVCRRVPADATAVLDVGCGEGNFLRIAHRNEDLVYHAVDNDPLCIETVKRHQAKLPNLVVYDNMRQFVDAAGDQPFVAMLNEVIEHNSPAGAEALLNLVLKQPGCSRAIVTTPNRAFNVNYCLDGLRHDDHKFEFTQAEFAEFVGKSAEMYGYTATVTGIGDQVDGEYTTLLAEVVKND